MPVANHRSGLFDEVRIVATETKKTDDPMNTNRIERKKEIIAFIRANVSIQLSCLYRKTGILQNISIAG